MLVREEDSTVVAPSTTVVRSREDRDAVRIALPVVALELVTGLLDLMGTNQRIEVLLL